MGKLTWLFHFLLCFSQYQIAFSSSSLSSFTSSSSPHPWPLCRHDQRSALLQFKHSFTININASSECDLYGVPSYPKTLYWDENATNCCNWDGVMCDELTGHVIGLDLSCSQLYGTIHPNSSLYQLSHLQRLILAYNNFNDSRISYAFGRFASLTHLNLSGSSFSGSIPSEISHLSKLISLDLSSYILRLEPLNFEILLKNLTRLQELVLRGVNISSELPDSVSNLTSLNSLILSGCKLEGPIPNSLGNLTQLRKLDLMENSFNGEVPSTLSNLKQLTFLRLYFNNLEGRIPDVFAELTMLEFLDLGYNNFIGGFPLSVAKLKPLLNLYIDSNQLTGPIPLNLSGLQNLQTLYLSNNSVSGVMDLQRLKNLEYLSLSNTNISVIANAFPNLKGFSMSSCNIEMFPGFLRTSEKLERLDLSNNRIRGQIPNWVMFIGKYSLQYLNLSLNFLTNIKQLPWEKLTILVLRSNLLQGPLPIPPPSIRYFSISNNSLSGEIPSLICNASSLYILDLSHNKFSGAVPQCLGNVSSALSVLDLHSNGFEGTLPLICNASSLYILDLSHNKFSGAVPQCLGNVSSVLSVLDLHSNGFKGTLPLVFAKPNNLRSLDLNGNQFEGPLPKSLTSCRSLEVLNVGNNKINDTFPDWLGSLPELQVLVIRSNRFHGPLNTLTSKLSFPKLRIVDLSYNEFTGHLPGRYFEGFQAMKNNSKSDKQYMSDARSYYHDSVRVTMKGIEIELVRILTIFTTIDFSSNNFSGEIPSVVGRLNSLIVLNFSHNSLTGHIPASIGYLTSLESLDISSNQLTGTIPSQLTSLTFLAVLNLSSNRLYGPIPHGLQFNTFENGSYAGNLGLHGFPSSDECEDNQTKVHLPVLQQQEDDPYFDGFTWKILVMGYGCGMPLGLFLGYLMFLIGRPKFFVRLVERKMPKKVTRLRRMVTDIADTRK